MPKGIPTIGEIKEHNVDRVFTVSSLVSFVSSVVMMLVLTVNNVIQVMFVCFFFNPTHLLFSSLFLCFIVSWQMAIFYRHDVQNFTVINCMVICTL